MILLIIHQFDKNDTFKTLSPFFLCAEGREEFTFFGSADFLNHPRTFHILTWNHFPISTLGKQIKPNDRHSKVGSYLIIEPLQIVLIFIKA